MTTHDSAAAPTICFVTADYAGIIRNGGIGTYVALMSQILADRGWSVHVLFCGPADDERALHAAQGDLGRSGITFKCLTDMPEPVWTGLPNYGDGLEALQTSQRVLEALELLHREAPFDVIEFPDWRALGFRSVQAKRAGVALTDTRLAVKLHGTTEWQRRGNLQERRSPQDLTVEYCERYAFEHADLQLSPSNFMLKDSLVQGWAVRRDAVATCPLPLRQRPSPPSSAEVAELVFFGRLEARKGLDLFLDALDASSIDLPVLFLGGDTESGGLKASELIAARMAERSYRIETGLDRDGALAELHREGRLAVIASRAESFGYTVAECIVEEVPFLAAAVGGILEVLDHEQARRRWLFEPTAEALAAALGARLEASEDEERALRAAVAEACDPDRWNNRVEVTYRDLARTSPNPRRPVKPADATVTVGVTYYEHPTFLPAALASLAAQTWSPEQVIVIDDGSTTPSALRVFAEQEAKYPNWTFLRQDNAGPGAARNTCLAHATGAFFIPFDSDNIAVPSLVETLLTAASADGPHAVSCHTLAFVDDSDIAAERFAYRYAPIGGPRLMTAVEDVFGDSCGLYQADALRAVGGFEAARWSPYEDWETYTKLAFAGYDVDVVPRVLFFYRTEAGGRLARLAQTPDQEQRLRRRMIHDILADVEVTRQERIVLWEVLRAFAEPTAEHSALQRAHVELSEWAHSTIEDVHAWRTEQLEAVNASWTEQIEDVNASWTERLEEVNAWWTEELEDLRSFLTAKVDEATERAEEAETRLAARALAQPRPSDTAPTAPRIPISYLAHELTDRLRRASRRRRAGVASRCRRAAERRGA